VRNAHNHHPLVLVLEQIEQAPQKRAVGRQRVQEQREEADVARVLHELALGHNRHELFALHEPAGAVAKWEQVLRVRGGALGVFGLQVLHLGEMLGLLRAVGARALHHDVRYVGALVAVAAVVAEGLGRRVPVERLQRPWGGGGGGVSEWRRPVVGSGQ
jgi:hypothetical protein